MSQTIEKPPPAPENDNVACNPMPPDGVDADLALIVMIVNIFVPGVGTMIVGCSAKRDGGAYIGIGIAQLIVSIFIFGYLWPVVWGILLFVNANKQRKQTVVQQPVYATAVPPVQQPQPVYVATSQPNPNVVAPQQYIVQQEGYPQHQSPQPTPQQSPYTPPTNIAMPETTQQQAYVAQVPQNPVYPIPQQSQSVPPPPPPPPTA